MDHLLLDRDTAWPALKPDVVLQLGGRLTSKRLSQFLEWAALGDANRSVLYQAQGLHAQIMLTTHDGGNE